MGNNHDDTTSGQLTRTHKQIQKDDEHNIELESTKKLNLRLLGEVSILRQNLINIEKENYTLKEKKNNNFIRSLNKTETLKKELNFLKTENKIKENQLKAFKRPNTFINSQSNKNHDIYDYSREKLDYKWVLKQISNENVFCLSPFNMHKLEIVHDYFFNEFIQMIQNTSTIINEMEKRKNDVRAFMKLFYMFAISKDIFFFFFKDIFHMYFKCEREKNDIKYLKNMQNRIYEIMCLIEFAWIVAFVEDKEFMEMYNGFVDMTCQNWCAIAFFKRIARERPFILNIFLSKDNFNQILNYCVRESHVCLFNELVDSMSVDILKGYVDQFNIEYINQEMLKKVFKSDFVDIQ